MLARVPTLFLALATLPAQPAQPTSPPELERLRELYRELHRHPELSNREVKTASRMAAELRALGAAVTERIGGLGVVGVLRNGEGPLLMLRADMDALPIAETTGLPYASTIRGESDEGRAVGVMHACGHDLHMTCLLGAAGRLAADKSAWRGTILCLFQPAEERGLGAKQMLDDQLFARFGKPDFALALHVAHDLTAGTIGHRAGWAMANVDSVDIVVHGRGGHGSTPHLTIDPIVIAAQLVVDLQTIVSRELAAQEPAVVTVGAIHGGSKHNIIPDQCELQLTVRSYSDAVREHIHAAIRRKAAAVAAAHRAPEPTVTFSEGTPALFNDEALVSRVVPVLRTALGTDNVLEVPAAMGGEDFSRYARAGVPVFMFRLGVVSAARLAALRQAGAQPPPLHSGGFYPDVDECLPTGIAALVAGAHELLPVR